METLRSLPKRVLIPLLIAALFAARALVRAYKWRTVRPNFQGKRVFVSGGSSGIGEAIAK